MKRRYIPEETPYLVPGFHGVYDCLLSGSPPIREIWIQKGKRSGRTQDILNLAGERGIPVRIKNPSEFSRHFSQAAHQGFAALIERFAYASLEHICAEALSHRDEALIIAADHITNEGNLGALIRTSAFFGAHGMLLPKDRSAGVTSNVLKRSSGGYLGLPVSRVVNLGRTLADLKKKGLWVIGASGEGGEMVSGFDWKRNLVLVVGHEQKGLSRAVKSACDAVVRIPRLGNVESLNVAVASGVILWEINRQRGVD